MKIPKTTVKFFLISVQCQFWCRFAFTEWFLVQNLLQREVTSVPLK